VGEIEYDHYRTELQKNGPFVGFFNSLNYLFFLVGVNVYSDLLQYSSGIYVCGKGAHYGIRYMLLIGWGVLNDIEYWIVQAKFDIINYYIIYKFVVGVFLGVKMDISKFDEGKMNVLLKVEDTLFILKVVLPVKFLRTQSYFSS
jgi:hypothetical protein